MHIPTLEEARDFLTAAEKMNPGPWIQHSLFVAEAAKEIATHHADLDPEAAYILGCLHDIGRREGVTGMRHMIDGYYFLQPRGFSDAARICLTHSFPLQNVHAVFGKWDCSDEELKFVEEYLSQVQYDNYDKLLQLCDCLALPSGFTLIEKRMVDVAMRYGTNEFVAAKWRATFDLQEEFEKAIGRSIYRVLPGVVENTFGFDPARND